MSSSSDNNNNANDSNNANGNDALPVDIKGLTLDVTTNLLLELLQHRLNMYTTTINRILSRILCWDGILSFSETGL